MVERTLVIARTAMGGLRAPSQERGQTLAEYSLIMTVIAIAVTVSALVVFRTQIAAIFDSATSCLSGVC